MIRLLIADDHPVVRAGLRSVLEAESDFDVVAEAATGAEAIERAGHADVVLMDLQFAGGGTQGVEATAAITARGTATVVVLTTYDNDADIVAAVEAGASGYLLKDTSPAHLVSAIRAAHRGEQVIGPTVTRRLVARVRQPTTGLSERELEVLEIVARGQSNRDVAKELFLSEATVKSHLSHIYGKLGVTSRTAAVAEARRSGIIRN